MPVAAITGGSRGFGLALGLRLVDEGWTIVVCAREGARLTDAYAAHLATGRVRLVVGDIQNEQVREGLAQQVDSLGALDVLVNNASVLGASPLPALREYPLAVLEEVFRVNTLAPLALVQRLLPYLVSLARDGHRRQLRRGSRGVPRLGWLWSEQGRAGPAERRPGTGGAGARCLRLRPW